MLEHGEGELMETETTKKKKPLFNDEEDNQYSNDLIKHHINKHTENSKGKVQKLSQAVDLSCRAQELTYTSHIHISMLQLPTATKTKKNHHVRR